MEIKNRLEQKISQQMKLSPAQMQAMKILELSVQQLEDRINAELDDNEALEEGEEKIEEE